MLYPRMEFKVFYPYIEGGGKKVEPTSHGQDPFTITNQMLTSCTSYLSSMADCSFPKIKHLPENNGISHNSSG